ncbi:dehydrogenase [Cupriavidus basilensis OR16]|uniref:Dehydrogenase n=1 Tax=Cupriavidus basilensis OR16 TaxID=1127483 RepID=H1SGT2_9BURK|nr:SDR family oxidoreductase [Cupriavidus basilensis]EHP38257.1 dehydrogenase [Cupriavidus basilensis OR16]
MATWTTTHIPPQAGKRAVVTGATGGLGFETALALAGAGADVILAGRNAAKGQEAVRRIHAAHPRATLRFELLDLASLASVADFSRRLLDEGRRIDILVNNAGVMALARRHVTADGFEMQLGTNYLGHFALTAQLLPLLHGAPHSRVVSLSSMAHRHGRIDLDDLQGGRAYKPWKAYAQSKLAMLMFALELQRRSDANGWGLLSNAAHPGWARTDLMTNGPGTNGMLGVLSRLLAPFFSQGAAQGALPTLLAATSPEARAAAYYGPDGFSEMKGAPARAKIMPQAMDREVAARLWERSSALTGAQWAPERERIPS